MARHSETLQACCVPACQLNRHVLLMFRARWYQSVLLQFAPTAFQAKASGLIGGTCMLRASMILVCTLICQTTHAMRVLCTRIARTWAAWKRRCPCHKRMRSTELCMRVWADGRIACCTAALCLPLYLNARRQHCNQVRAKMRISRLYQMPACPCVLKTCTHAHIPPGGWEWSQIQRLNIDLKLQCHNHRRTSWLCVFVCVRAYDYLCGCVWGEVDVCLHLYVCLCWCI